MASRLEPLQVSNIMERLEAAEIAALEQMGTAIVQKARAKAPVRKIYEEATGRKRGDRASEETVAAAIRFIKNNKRLTATQRTSALYLLERHPENARLLSRRKGSVNQNRLRRLKSVQKRQLSAQGRYELKTRRAFVTLEGGTPEKGAKASTLLVGGRLKNSILKSMADREGNRMVLNVSATAPYALFVEFPTRHNRAQPFLLPALKESQQLFKTLLEDELRIRGLKKG